ncbi:MAG: LacI family DNA-binding transcriptional regulator [Victivallales bacterium]|nr:LacI family DNA-binding transcriptional regulator [Victivallales bacterium]
MNVTMKSIAREIGVSQPVVSAVLNNRSYCRVSEEKREAILALARKLNFRTNSAARRLKGKKTNTIVIFTGRNCSVLQNEILRSMLGLLEIRHLHSYTIAVSDEQELNEKLLDMNALGVDAFIGFYLDFELNIQEMALPGVSVGVQRRHPDIAANAHQGAELLCRHVLGHGYRRIAFLCNTVEANIDKYSAIEHCIRASRRRSASLKTLEFHHNPNVVEEIFDAVKKDKTEVFMASNDFVAARLMSLLQHSGIEVPGQVAITGFDGLSVGMMTSVSLTTAVQPAALIAEQTAELLCARMEHRETERRILLPVDVLVGESCGCRQTFQPGFYWDVMSPLIDASFGIPPFGENFAKHE